MRDLYKIVEYVIKGFLPFVLFLPLPGDHLLTGKFVKRWDDGFPSFAKNVPGTYTGDIFYGFKSVTSLSKHHLMLIFFIGRGRLGSVR